MYQMYNPMLTPQQQMQQIEQRMSMYPNMGMPINGNQPNMQSMQPMAINDNSGINWVNGFEGAKAALIPLDKPVLLMDSTDSKFYIKQINAQGSPVIQAYRFHPEDASSSVATSAPSATKETATKEPTVAEKNETVLLEKLTSICSRLDSLEQKLKVKGGTTNG